MILAAELLGQLAREPLQAARTNPQGDRLVKNYDRAAWFYETSAEIFSLGQIGVAKRYAVSLLKAGERVIFLGGGSGDDAVFAAERGCQVTSLDISTKMLKRLESRLQQRQLTAEIICQSAFEHQRPDYYDACQANFFFNIFRQEEMLCLLRQSAMLLRPGGRLMIADVSLAQGNVLYRAFNIAYLKAAMLSYWLLGLTSLHRNYDYQSYFPGVGLELDYIQHFRLFPGGPIVYQVTVGRKPN